MKFAPLFLILLLGALRCPAAYTSLQVFGDSLSDTGTIFRISSAVGSPMPESPLYYQGRFSNGPLYVEQLGFTVDPGLFGGTNFAVGGARTASHTGGDLLAGLSLQGQVTSFDTATGGVAPPDSLYLLWIGGNDIRDGVLGGDPTAGSAIIGDALEVVEMAILDLRAMGARHIIVPNQADLGLIPEFNRDPASRALGLALSNEWNAGLASLVAGFGDPDIELFDVHRIFEEVFADPAAFGFANTTDQGILDPDHADEYIFWDENHPTAATHAILAQELLLLVPEPSSVTLMMLAGVVAAASRRRPSQRRLAARV